MVNTLSPPPAPAHSNTPQPTTYKPHNPTPRAQCTISTNTPNKNNPTTTTEQQTPRIHLGRLHTNLPSKTLRNSNYRSHPENFIKSPEPYSRIKPITLHYENISGTIWSIFIRIRMVLLVSCVIVRTLGVWGSVSE